MTAPLFSHSEDDTIAIARDFAATLTPRDVVLLTGDLGAGKSVFSRAVIRTLMQDPEAEVPSPTFTLLQNYDTSLGSLTHFDLYRLKDSEEIFEIGWEEALASGTTLVEWPDRLGAYTPKNHIHIAITITPAGRSITIRRSLPT